VRAPSPVASDGEVLLQVGSFGERENARRLADRLRDGGVDEVDIDHVELDGRDLWRVRVGPVSADDLAAVRDRLHRLELPEPRVVRD